jgi:hypothetical protein
MFMHLPVKSSRDVAARNTDHKVSVEGRLVCSQLTTLPENYLPACKFGCTAQAALITESKL